MFWDGPSSSTSPGGPLRDQTSMEPHDHGSSVDFDAVVASKSLAKLPEDRRILMCEVADLKRRLRIKEGECDSLMFRVNDNLMFQVQADKYTGLYEQLYSEHKTCESRRQKWKLKKLATLDKLAKAEKKNEDHLVRSTTAEEENLRLVREKEMAAAAHEVERVRLVRGKEMAAAAHEVERVRLVREKEMAAAAHEVERGNLDKEIAEIKSRLESGGEKYAELLAKHKDFHGAAQNRLQHLERENQELRNKGMKFEADCQELYQQMGLAQEKIQILEETNRKLASHRETILKENQALQEHMNHCHGNWKQHADKLQQVERENEELLMKFEADCQELYQQVRLAQEKSQSLKVTNLKLASQREFILKENQALQSDTKIAQVGGGAQMEGQKRQIEEQQRQIGDNQALAQEARDRNQRIEALYRHFGNEKESLGRVLSRTSKWLEFGPSKAQTQAQSQAERPPQEVQSQAESLPREGPGPGTWQWQGPGPRPGEGPRKGSWQWRGPGPRPGEESWEWEDEGPREGPVPRPGEEWWLWHPAAPGPREGPGLRPAAEEVDTVP